MTKKNPTKLPESNLFHVATCCYRVFEATSFGWIILISLESWLSGISSPNGLKFQLFSWIDIIQPEISRNDIHDQSSHDLYCIYISSLILIQYIPSFNYFPRKYAQVYSQYILDREVNYFMIYSMFASYSHEISPIYIPQVPSSSHDFSIFATGIHKYS